MSSAIQNPYTALSMRNLEPAEGFADGASANADTQLYIVPTNAPAAGRLYLFKLHIHNGTASAAVFLCWDEHLTELAAAKRFTNAAPMIKINIPASADVTLGIDKLPLMWFQAGVAFRISQASSFVRIEGGLDVNE